MVSLSNGLGTKPSTTGVIRRATADGLAVQDVRGAKPSPSYIGKYILHKPAIE